ncbi:neutral zinc metallopeptidase [Luedemannella flava]|uniref:Neutral zinc metallopeptidase n=1 Tax=Luedemannella flava TaxID=349316 RepID=A0ABN2LJZ3_9ACTN
MELNENAEADTSQVTDRRGSGGGLGGIPIPIGGLGGGIGGLVVLALLVIGGFVGGNTLFGGEGDNGNIEESCSTANPDRLKNADCRNLLYVNSIQAYWEKALPESFGEQYQQADTNFFSQAVSTGCGNADSGVGPFYCPQDDQVYIDLTFYNELANRFGADGEFAQPYVLAHEYGHHVQDLLGTEADVRRQMERDPGNQNALSVKLELQADCYAGVWAKHATETTSRSGKPIFKSITQADIDQALDAAAAIGDDAIQKKMGGSVDESKFTHGSSAQRKQWFTTGYQSGDPKSCNTFA